MALLEPGVYWLMFNIKLSGKQQNLSANFCGVNIPPELISSYQLIAKYRVGKRCTDSALMSCHSRQKPEVQAGAMAQKQLFPKVLTKQNKGIHTLASPVLPPSIHSSEPLFGQTQPYPSSAWEMQPESSDSLRYRAELRRGRTDESKTPGVHLPSLKLVYKLPKDRNHCIVQSVHSISIRYFKE